MIHTDCEYSNIRRIYLDVIYHHHEAWSQARVFTLANGWKKLLDNTDVDFTDSEVSS